MNRPPDAVIRGAILFAAGLIAGLFVAQAFHSSGDADAARADEARRAQARSANAGSADKDSTAEATKLVLGNIMTVPFQELYSVLAARPAAELAELAHQLGALPPGHEKEQKSAKFFKAWAHFDPNAAMKAAIALDSPKMRAGALHAVLEGADATAGESLAKAINALAPEALPPNMQRGLVGQAASKWSEIDAAGAAAFIDTVPSTPGSIFGDLHTIAQNWALSDPQSALAWAQQHDRGGSASVAFATDGAIFGWWQKDPAAAEAYVASHLSTPSDRQLASGLASQMFQTDPQHAMEWVSRLPDIEARRQADSVIASQIAWTDSKASAEWAANLPPDVRSNALNSTVNMWAQKDPAAAAEWLGGLSGTARDQAVSGYSSAVSTKDPVTALTWATTISDPRTRDNSVERIVRGWLQRSPAEATSWVQNSTLTADAKARLLGTPPPPGG